MVRLAIGLGSSRTALRKLISISVFSASPKIFLKAISLFGSTNLIM
jgi:hypothetical protein